MSGRRWLCVLALVAAAACSEATGPTIPAQKKPSLAKPTGASYARYILISGVVTCVEDCGGEGDPGAAVQAAPMTGADSLPAVVVPVDSTGGN